MIYPTRAAILAAAATVPIALVIAALFPRFWYAGVGWPMAVLLLAAADAVTGAPPRSARAEVALPHSIGVGEALDAAVSVTVPGVQTVELALARDPLLAAEDAGHVWALLEGGAATVPMPLIAERRGVAQVTQLWVRWRGAFGLVWKQRRFVLDAMVPILPDIRPVRDPGSALLQRRALAGLLAQQDRGDGTDFEALVEYRSGMDRRAIDWKQSARHSKLHAKEYRPERNNQIVLAIDSGRQMTDPIEGLPRVDRAVSAALLTAWVALKAGDRVSLWGFDSRPRVASGFVSGAAGFPELKRIAADIAYSGEETNHTLALTHLGTGLTRRSMIVLFTEFSDTVAAGFLVNAARRIAKTHLLIVVVLRDAELDGFLDRRPETVDDVTRAVTAGGLLRDRLVVLTSLRRLGAIVVEAEYDRVGERLVAAYVEAKRRNLV